MQDMGDEHSALHTVERSQPEYCNQICASHQEKRGDFGDGSEKMNKNHKKYGQT